MMSCQPAQHEADGGEEDEGDGAVREVLEILGEAPTAIEPAMVRSTIQRFGRSLKPAPSQRLTISSCQLAMARKTCSSLGP